MTSHDDLRALWRTIAIGVAILDGAALLGFVIAGAFSWQVITGLAYGTVFALAGFWLLCRHTARAVTLSEGAARRYMMSRYMMRYLLYGLAIVVALISPWLHGLAAVLPFCFPQLVILALHLKKQR